MMRTHRTTRSNIRRVEGAGGSFSGIRELGLLSLLLLLFNLPVFLGTGNPFSYNATAVTEGQWWRLLTHPFTHVSPYHFILDGIAFVALWAGIAGTPWRRVALTIASAAGALILSVALSPAIQSAGLCGLSGVAHGLMIALAADTAGRVPKKDGIATVSLLTIAIAFAKAAYELISGDLAFDFIHRGSLGVPIVECHAGGAAGATLFLVIEQVISRATRSIATAPATPLR